MDPGWLARFASADRRLRYGTDSGVPPGGNRKLCTIRRGPRACEGNSNRSHHMNLSPRHKLAAAAAAAAVLGGAAGALLAVTGGQSASPSRRAAAAQRSRGEISAAASYLGLKRAELRRRVGSGESLAGVADATGGRSSAGLIDAILAVRLARLRAEVAAGSITAAAANARASRLRALVTERVQAAGHAGAPSGRPRDQSLAAAAVYLGIPSARLRRELGRRRTLAQIAGAIPGKSAAGLTAALLSARKRALDAAVAAGRLSPCEGARAAAAARRARCRAGGGNLARASREQARVTRPALPPGTGSYGTLMLAPACGQRAPLTASRPTSGGSREEAPTSNWSQPRSTRQARVDVSQ